MGILNFVVGVKFQSLSQCFRPGVEKVVDSASLTRRKYSGNSDLADFFGGENHAIFCQFWKEQLIL